MTRSPSDHVLLERWNAVEADRRVGPGIGARTLQLDPVADFQVLRQLIGRVLIEHVEFFASRPREDARHRLAAVARRGDTVFDGLADRLRQAADFPISR